MRPLASPAAAVGRAHAGERCTLDGRPATIGGRLTDFATVAILPDGPAYSFAWSTVARVMLAGGRFKS